MTILVEGRKSFFLAAQAALIDDTHECAWAEKIVRPNPAYKWVLGKYVEANSANSNKQFWALDQLQLAQPSIQHAPMNLLHRPRHIVGAFVATEMVYPTGPDETAAAANPFIEALGVYWKYYFPEELVAIEEAHATGSLFFSMECVSNSITCAGEMGCGKEFAYAGPRHETYCDHINGGTSIKQLNQPHFLAGALIIPPERPGWTGASITEMSTLVKQHADECEKAYEEVKKEAPHLEPKKWESVMASLLQQAKLRESARDFNTQQRDKLAKSGAAMPDGSYPIVTVSDLKNAVQAIGRAKNPGAVKRHIIKRARALGATNLLPADWVK